MASEKDQTTIVTPPPSERDGEIKEIDYESNTSSIDERKLIQRIDLRLLPSVTVLYLLSFLDRSNGKTGRWSTAHGMMLTTLQSGMPRSMVSQQPSTRVSTRA